MSWGGDVKFKTRLREVYNKRGKPVADVYDEDGRVSMPRFDMFGRLAYQVYDSKRNPVYDRKGRKLSGIYDRHNRPRQVVYNRDQEEIQPKFDKDGRPITFLFDENGIPLYDAEGKPWPDATLDPLPGEIRPKRRRLRKKRRNPLTLKDKQELIMMIEQLRIELKLANVLPPEDSKEGVRKDIVDHVKKAVRQELENVLSKKDIKDELHHFLATEMMNHLGAMLKLPQLKGAQAEGDKQVVNESKEKADVKDKLHHFLATEVKNHLDAKDELQHFLTTEVKNHLDAKLKLPQLKEAKVEGEKKKKVSFSPLPPKKFPQSKEAKAQGDKKVSFSLSPPKAAHEQKPQYALKDIYKDIDYDDLKEANLSEIERSLDSLDCLVTKHYHLVQNKALDQNVIDTNSAMVLLQVTHLINKLFLNSKILLDENEEIGMELEDQHDLIAGLEVKKTMSREMQDALFQDIQDKLSRIFAELLR